MQRASRLACLVPVGLALIAPAAAEAMPDYAASAAAAKSKLRLASISSPPKVAAPGAKFTLVGRVTNRTRSTQRATVQITLRRTKGAFPKPLQKTTLARIKPGRTLRFSV